VSDDGLSAALRKLGEALGHDARVVDRIVKGHGDPSVRNPVALASDLGLSESAAAGLARDLAGGSGADRRGSVLDAFAEVHQRRPFGLSAAEAVAWAKQRVRDVARQFEGRPDAAEARCWEIVAGLRQAGAFMPATTSATRAPAEKAPPRKAPARSSRTLTESGDIVRWR
jgi:hypothetical protein